MMNFTHYQDENAHLDLAGLGSGPFNLSLAALLDSLPELKIRFFDKKPAFGWHPGAYAAWCSYADLLPERSGNCRTTHQSLVFLVIPGGKGTVLFFLATEKMVISRSEFVEYMSWVAENLESLQFDSEIREVSFEEGSFVLRSDKEKVKAHNLCLGTGKVPYIPDCARALVGQQCFHASELMSRQPDLRNRKVAIIGGGQTGAEVFLNCLREQWGKADQIQWISRRASFEPLDESPFTNEYFTPDYVSRFLSLPEEKKDTIVEYQKLASDGITPAYLLEIYRELYDRTYLSRSQVNWKLLPDRTLTAMSESSVAFTISS